jgi:Ca2+-binding EF-hand superfamily protein
MLVVFWEHACWVTGGGSRASSETPADERERDANLNLPRHQPHRALSLPPSSAHELRSVITSIDPLATGFVSYPSFLAVCALKLRARTTTPKAAEEAVDAAFRLFTHGDDEGPITMAHLRRVARELKEDVSEDVLRDMILEANGGSSVARGVRRDEFEDVMRRAGAF